MGPIMYLLASQDYYEPATSAEDRGRRYCPTQWPPSWSSFDQGIWTYWTHPGGQPENHGWKIHISTTFRRAEKVLDIVAQTCFEHQVWLKHVSHELFFTLIHHKQTNPCHSAKFITIYPGSTDAARNLLKTLYHRLRGEEGPYIAGDRRYRDSQTIHYRYGVHRDISRVNLDGTRSYFMESADGAVVEDVRAHTFRLPFGLEDPFVSKEELPTVGSLTIIPGYEPRRILRQTAAGCALQAVNLHNGTEVFIKEARAGNGLIGLGVDAVSRLQHEYRVLSQIHRISPGTCPAPLELITRRDHTFLVTEYVDGISLEAWVARHHPLTRIAESSQFDDYHAQCIQLLESARMQFAGIRLAGYRYGDLSPADILVCGHDRIRLVDFEASTQVDGPPSTLGTPNFEPTAMVRKMDAFDDDEYAISVIAQQMIFPFHPVLQRNPAAIELLDRDLPAATPSRDAVWRVATRFVRADSRPHWQPAPDDLTASPRRHLQKFADELCAAVLANANPADTDSIFPTIPVGYETNTLCLAYGAAGVLHALGCYGATIPQDVITEFACRAEASIDKLPPGLYFGLAGVSYVLATCREGDLARRLLHQTLRRRKAISDISLGQGLAGIGLACLRTGELLGDSQMMGAAADLAEQIRSIGAEPQPDNIGLLSGSSGVALFLHELGSTTGETTYVRIGREFLARDLDRLVRVDPNRLSVAQGRRNLYPYLGSGTAGVLLASSRFSVGNAPIADVAHLIPDVESYCTRRAGLFTGLAGLVFSFADHSRRSDDLSDERVMRLATALLKYGLTDRSGVSVLGEGLVRMSSELWSGGAGVLLAITHALRQERHPPLLFTPAPHISPHVGEHAG